MCLVSNRFFPKIAKTDIVCYKLLKVIYNNKQVMFLSPIRDYDYTKEVLETKVLKPSFKSCFNGFIEHFSLSTFDYFAVYIHYEVNGGYVHAYQNRQYNVNDYIVYIKCIIPKGTLYYEDHNDKTFAAKKLIIVDDELDNKIQLFVSNETQKLQEIKEQHMIEKSNKEYRKKLHKRKKKKNKH